MSARPPQARCESRPAARTDCRVTVVSRSRATTRKRAPRFHVSTRPRAPFNAPSSKCTDASKGSGRQGFVGSVGFHTHVLIRGICSCLATRSIHTPPQATARQNRSAAPMSRPPSSETKWCVRALQCAACARTIAVPLGHVSVLIIPFDHLAMGEARVLPHIGKRTHGSSAVNDHLDIVRDRNAEKRIGWARYSH